MNMLVAVAAQVAGAVAAQIKTTVDTYGGEYADSISAEYYTSIYEACYDYLTSTGSVATYKNAARRAVVNNFPSAFYSGYADGGGEETEDDDEAWLTGRMNAELGFIDGLFASLRDKRIDGSLSRADADVEASTRAEGYRQTLNAVYNEGKLRGSKNRSLLFDGDDGAENCETCAGLKGKRHTIKWIIANDMMIYPGNKKYKCQCYKCQHKWIDPKTKESFTG